MTGFQRRLDARLVLSVVAIGVMSFAGVVVETAMNIAFPALMTELGTDVNIAIHSLRMAFFNAYDAAIFVSGDTDYLPIYETLRMMGNSSSSPSSRDSI